MWAELTSQNKPQLKTGTNVSTILGHFQKCLTHPKYHDKRIFRIPLKTDPRIFTKVARNSKKWKRLYKKRTSIERVNGRIDHDFQFEKHTIRGLKKMKMLLNVTFIIQLTLAKAKIESGITNGLARYTA